MTIEAARDSLMSSLCTLYEEREAASITHWVMEHITGMNRVDRMIHKQQLLDIDQFATFQHIHDQLVSGKPLQYVLGEAWFAGMRFMVNEYTLIPRPETEELIEWIKAVANSEPLSILDIGTGSGCIPISIKKSFPLWHVHSVDVSKEALLVADENARTLHADVVFRELDFLNEKRWTTLPSFDIIVSNPPYIRLSECCTMSVQVLEHEPHLALFVQDNDALIFYRKIAAFGLTHLKRTGLIFMEINQALGKEVCNLFESFGYTVQLRKDIHDNDRMIMASLPG